MLKAAPAAAWEMIEAISKTLERNTAESLSSACGSLSHVKSLLKNSLFPG
jgi:hypothetical protein